MRKALSEAGQVDVSDMWPAVELTPTGASQKLSLKWAQDRIVELKTCNLRFIRAMDTAGVDPGELAAEFTRSFEFFGEADGYLTYTLQMLRRGNCESTQLTPLFSAISQLVNSLGDARRQMLDMMPVSLRRVVVESELEVDAGPEDVEEEMAEMDRMKVDKRKVAAVRRH